MNKKKSTLSERKPKPCKRTFCVNLIFVKVILQRKLCHCLFNGFFYFKKNSLLHTYISTLCLIVSMSVEWVRVNEAHILRRANTSTLHSHINWNSNIIFRFHAILYVAFHSTIVENIWENDDLFNCFNRL